MPILQHKGDRKLSNVLVPVSRREIDGEVVQTVDARELHSFLGVGSKFYDWITRRIKDFGFMQGIDFIELKNESQYNQVVSSIDYFLTLDMAKELSMVERNEKGKQARQYFIECERVAKSNILPFKVPTTLTEALEVALEQARLNEQNQKLIAVMTPKAQMFDAVMQTDTWIDMGTVAKLLAIPKMGRNNLFEYLRDAGVLMEGNRRNAPYQVYVDAGYFKVVETGIYSADNIEKVGFKTVVSQKGLAFITDMLLDDGYEPRTLKEAA